MNTTNTTENKTGVDLQPPEVSQAAHVTPNLLKVLAERFTPEMIADKIAGLLDATHLTKGGQQIVDNRAVEAGVKLLLAYQIGLPVQRQEIVQISMDGGRAIEDRMAKSPALRAALKEKIAEMEAEEGDINTIPDSVKSSGEPTKAKVTRRVKKK